MEREKSGTVSDMIWGKPLTQLLLSYSDSQPFDVDDIHKEIERWFFKKSFQKIENNHSQLPYFSFGPLWSLIMILYFWNKVIRFY